MTTKLTRPSEISFRTNHDGIATCSVTPGDSRWMRAEALHLVPGAVHADRVKGGSDGFLYMISGEAQFSDGSRAEKVSKDAAVLIPEGTAYSLRANSETYLMRMTTKVAADGALSGLADSGFKIKDVWSLPKVELTRQNRRTIPFVTVEDDRSQRAHGMIVECLGGTAGTLHHHPDSESIFLFLSGTAVLTANGAERRVEKGDFAFFGLGDPHSLRSDAEGVTFLEYHTPSHYSIIKL